MYILAIETTGAEASVALINENGLLDFEISTERLNHLQNLMPMTQKLLNKRELAIDDISHIAVSEGPGSFTGIRIGVSTARALAQALKIDIIPVPTLKAFAFNCPDYKGLICPIFDARREQVYAGAYAWNENGAEITGSNGAEIIEKVKGGAWSIQEFFDELEKVAEGQEVMFFGDGIGAYEKQISVWAEKVGHNENCKGKETKPEAIPAAMIVKLAPEEIRFQKASSVALLGLDLLKTGGAVEFEKAKPVYMRKAEAQRKLEECQI